MLRTAPNDGAHDSVRLRCVQRLRPPVSHLRRPLRTWHLAAPDRTAHASAPQRACTSGWCTGPNRPDPCDVEIGRRGPASCPTNSIGSACGSGSVAAPPHARQPSGGCCCASPFERTPPPRPFRTRTRALFVPRSLGIRNWLKAVAAVWSRIFAAGSPDRVSGGQLMQQ